MDNEKKAIKRIQRLSDCTLVRLLLRRLWQWLDAAGVSMGRSMRGGLLKAIIWDLVKMPNIKAVDEFKKYILLHEAEKRAKKARKIHFKVSEKLPPLEDVNNRTLAHLILFKLQEWYKQDEEDSLKRREFPLTSEKEIIDACIPLLPPTQNCLHLCPLKWEDILQEVINRRSDKAIREFKKPLPRR